MTRTAKPDLEFNGPETSILNEAAAAKVLGTTEEAVRELCRKRKIVAQRPGQGGYKMTRRAILAYLEGGAE